MKVSRYLSLYLLAVLAWLPTMGLAQPSAILGQELAETASRNSLNIDLVNGYAGGTEVRFGALDGEIQVLNQVHSNAYTLGYKRVLKKQLGNGNKGSKPIRVAAYGAIGVDTPAGGGSSTTVFSVGAAVSQQSRQFEWNVNPRLENDGNDNWLDVLLGGFVPVKNNSVGKKLLVGAEVELQLDAPVGVNKENVTRLGLRWQPISNASIDLALYDSSSGLEVPGLLRVNISF